MFQYPHYPVYVESSKYWCCGPCLSTPSIFRSPSGHLSYCHHFASVVCKLFSFQSSSPKLHGALEPNLACMLIKWYFTKFYLCCRLEIQHGCHGQQCVLIGWYFKNLLLRNHKVGFFSIWIGKPRCRHSIYYKTLWEKNNKCFFLATKKVLMIIRWSIQTLWASGCMWIVYLFFF